jgi:2',3'-cyclic-nucleotide 2'-phosphodiesterase (5'-nucleotidase family)
MLQPYRDQLGPILSGVVGSSTKVIPRADSCGGSTGRLCESLIGNVITDAMRETYETDFALMNSGGIRADLTCPAIDSPTDFCPAFVPPPYVITKGQVLTVLPFGNVGDVIPVNGLELKGILENAVSRVPAADGRFGQVSGLCLTYDIEAAAGSRVMGAVYQAADGSCTGGAVDLTAGSSYTLATNDFVVAGGDGYPVYTDRGATRGVLDQDVSAWLETAGTVNPVLQGRIVCFDANPGAGNNCSAILP